MNGDEPAALRVLPCGEHAVLLEVAAPDVPAARDAVVAAVADRPGAGVTDVVPGARTVLVDGLRGLGPAELAAQVGAALRERSPRPGAWDDQRVVEVPTRYDGDDLAEVARLWDMTTTEVVATHTEASFVVAFCGFAPGFAYCTGLPERLHVPRRPTPRPRVPAGSVGLAGEYTGVYPTASPGGWQLVGRTDLVLWDSAADPPATLPPGTRVRFVEVTGPWADP